MEAIVTSPVYPSINLPAEVAAISPSFTQPGGTSPARIEVTGRERIYASGAPVEVVVTIRYVPDAIVISASALFQDDGNNTFYVFLAGSDGRAKS